MAQPPVMYNMQKEEEKKDDGMQIDSTGVNNEEEIEQIDANQMEEFMSPQERQRAETYYQ